MTAPEADAPQELQFRLHVDEAHCDRAAQGLRLMAAYQYRDLVKRYEGKRWLVWVRRVVLKVAPTLAVVVFIAGLVALGVGWSGWVDASVRRVYTVLAAILFLEAPALWLLGRRVERIRASVQAWFARFFGNRAAALMRKTRRAVPFEGVYDLRGDLLTYARIEKGQWTQYWHRRLGKFLPRGVALQTPGLLAIFPKPGAVVPVMLFLVAEDDAMAAAIRALGWTIVAIDPTPRDPRAGAA